MSENGEIFHGRDYFAGLRVTKRNKATVLLTLTLLQTPTLRFYSFCDNFSSTSTLVQKLIANMLGFE